MAYLNRSDLLAAVVLPRKVVPVPELGGEIIVRGMSGAQRDAWEASLAEGKGRKRQMNYANIRAKLVAQCCIDEQGNRLFTDEDAAAFGEVRVDVLDRLFSVAQKLSGVSNEDIDELGPKPLMNAEASTSPSLSS